MNDEKSFQLFRDEDEEVKEDLKAVKSNTLAIVILLLVIAGAVSVLGYAITRSDKAEPLKRAVDPNLGMMEPRQFMIDLVTSIRGFNDLLESIEDEEAFAVTEVAFADFVEEMEDIANRSLGQSNEPKEEEREELYAMLGELETEVVRMEGIAQQKRSDRELWKQIDPLYSRFEAAMRMVPMIPPAGTPKQLVENPGEENPETIPDEPVGNPETEEPEAIPDEPVENPGTQKSEANPGEPETC